MGVLLGGPKGMLPPPPSQIIGGGPGPPLPTPMKLYSLIQDRTLRCLCLRLYMESMYSRT